MTVTYKVKNLGEIATSFDRMATKYDELASHAAVKTIRAEYSGWAAAYRDAAETLRATVVVTESEETQ